MHVLTRKYNRKKTATHYMKWSPKNGKIEFSFVGDIILYSTWPMFLSCLFEIWPNWFFEVIFFLMNYAKNLSTWFRNWPTTSDLHLIPQNIFNLGTTSFIASQFKTRNQNNYCFKIMTISNFALLLFFSKIYSNLIGIYCGKINVVKFEVEIFLFDNNSFKRYSLHVLSIYAILESFKWLFRIPEVFGSFLKVLEYNIASDILGLRESI